MAAAYIERMDDIEFDTALVASAFSLAGERGWSAVSVTAAARAADLKLDRARGRFMGRSSILGRFGRLADQHALVQSGLDGSHRDRLFDLLMRRLDYLQTHREGVLALKTYLPRDPGLALMLAAATRGSMAWMLEAAGLTTRGLRGSLRVQGALAVWLATLRAWERDASEDLAGTMAALDQALDRAVQAESWLRFGRAEDADQPAADAGLPIDASAADAAAVEPSINATPEVEPEASDTRAGLPLPLPMSGDEPPMPPPTLPEPPRLPEI